jgi:thiol-disulfide isomerase/thioredoxin
MLQNDARIHDKVERVSNQSQVPLRRSRREWLALGTAGTAFAAAGATLAGCRRLTGSPAPAFEATTQYGRQVQLSDYRGKLLLLTFWATWCPYCRSQLAAMDQFLGGPQSAQVALLALSIDATGWEAVRPYLGQAGHTLSIGVADASTRRAYRTSGGIPITYVISTEGMVLTDIVGGLDLASLREIAAKYTG